MSKMLPIGSVVVIVMVIANCAVTWHATSRVRDREAELWISYGGPLHHPLGRKQLESAWTAEEVRRHYEQLIEQRCHYLSPNREALLLVKRSTALATVAALCACAALAVVGKRKGKARCGRGDD